MKNKITSLAWAIMIAVAIIITAIVISVAIRMFIPYGEYIVIGIGVLIGVSLVYRDLYPKTKYFLVSFIAGKNNEICGSSTFKCKRFIPKQVCNDIKNVFKTRYGEEFDTGNIIITNVFELSKDDYELDQKMLDEGSKPKDKKQKK